MRRVPVTGFILTLAACGGGEKKAADTAAAPAAEPAAAPAPPPGISLADVAGTWDMHSIPTTGDTTPTVYVMKATNADTGWTMTFKGRKTPVPVKVVSVAGDSIVTQAGPFESARRKGVQVTTEQVLRLSGGKLVGNVVAHYQTAKADSVLQLRSEGTKKP